jgi:hypothetical protein
MIGYDDSEIDALLPDLYDAMAVDLRSWREFMHKSPTKQKESSIQPHLLPSE